MRKAHELLLKKKNKCNLCLHADPSDDPGISKDIKVKNEKLEIANSFQHLEAVITVPNLKILAKIVQTTTALDKLRTI